MLKPRSPTGTLASLLIIAGALACLVLAGKLLVSLVAFVAHEDRLAVGNVSEGAGQPSVLSSARGAREQATGLPATAARAFVLDERVVMRPEMRAQAAAEALMLNPTDALLWTAYARAVVNSGFEIKHALTAVEMSRLSGRREQVAMLERAALTLAIWEKVPPEFRSAALRDLHEVRWFLLEPQRAALARAIAAKPDGVRQDIEAQVARAMAN